MIVGIDEVGRGPWAGPLVVGAVIMGGENIDGLTDSKKLTKKRRDELDIIIREKAFAYGLGWVSAAEIDTLGLASALELACRRALDVVDTLGVAYHEIVIDGTINLLKNTTKGPYVTTMKKADLLVPSVSAASIIAKVARDNYMAEQDIVYPGYGFASHVGYGTAMHRQAIDKLGVTPLHRLSFAPLSKYRPSKSETHAPSPSANAPSTTTKEIGNKAEDEASNHLIRNGHSIIDRNWKTKYCEIDIISKKDDTVYFTEVKYRKNPGSGDGMSYITKKKLNQMNFAAKFYAHINKISENDLRLCAISMTGNPAGVEDMVIVD